MLENVKMAEVIMKHRRESTMSRGHGETMGEVAWGGGAAALFSASGSGIEEQNCETIQNQLGGASGLGAVKKHGF